MLGFTSKKNTSKAHWRTTELRRSQEKNMYSQTWVNDVPPSARARASEKRPLVQLFYSNRVRGFFLESCNTTVSMRKRTRSRIQSHMRHFVYRIFTVYDLTQDVVYRGFTTLDFGRGKSYIFVYTIYSADFIFIFSIPKRLLICFGIGLN